MARVFALEGTNNKAIVTEKDGKSILTSYTTDVAEYDYGTNKMNVNGYYSVTTGGHINKFLEFHGFKKMTKQKLIEEFNITESV